jgi:hypothetical protein
MDTVFRDQAGSMYEEPIKDGLSGRNFGRNRYAATPEGTYT